MNKRYSLLTVVILYLSVVMLGSLVMMGLGSQTTYTFSPYSDFDRGELENEMEESINNYRSENGYERLDSSDFLDSGARDKSEDMVNNGYFGHTNPDGERVDYESCTSFSENIAKIPYKKITFSEETIISIPVDEDDVSERYIKDMIKSEDHRENILSSWDSHGVGVDIDNKNNLYITHHMCS